MTHSALQKKIALLMSKRGNGFNIVSSNRRGRPDIVGHIAVVFLAIEIKVGRDVLRPAQRQTLLDITKKGGLGIVVHEKHLQVFTTYLDSIVKQIDDNVSINSIGKPTPIELLVIPFEDVASFKAVSI